MRMKTDGLAVVILVKNVCYLLLIGIFFLWPLFERSDPLEVEPQLPQDLAENSNTPKAIVSISAVRETCGIKKLLWKTYSHANSMKDPTKVNFDFLSVMISLIKGIKISGSCKKCCRSQCLG